MSHDIPGIGVDAAFFCLAKFDGDQVPKPAGISDYESLCKDLLNPQCVELVVGGKSHPTQIWRK
jgi:hypothetical protein